MDRKNLIDHLVSQKLASKGKDRTFCICLARNICFAGTQQPTPNSPKK